MIILLASLTIVVYCSHACRQRDLNTAVSAENICLPKGTVAQWLSTGKLRDKIQLVLDKTTAGTIQTINVFDSNDLPYLNLFKEPFVAGTLHWPYPTLTNGLLPVSKMTQSYYTTNYQAPVQDLSYEFKCQGTMHVGCMEDMTSEVHPPFNAQYTDNPLWIHNSSAATMTTFNCWDVTNLWSPAQIPCDPYCTYCKSGTCDYVTLPVCNTNNGNGGGNNCPQASGSNAQNFNNVIQTNGAPGLTQNCYCSFVPSVCDFDKYVTGRIAPMFVNVASDEIAGVLTLVNPGDYTNAKITVNTGTSFRQIMNLTAMLKIGFGISSRIEITVCGQETLTPSAGNLVYVYNGMQPATPKVIEAFSPTVMQNSFTFGYPAIPTTTGVTSPNSADPNWAVKNANYDWFPAPNGWTSCTINFVQITNDPTCSTPHVSPTVFLDFASAKSAQGFQGVNVDRTQPVKLQDFYYCVQTRGLVSAQKTLSIEICGLEVVESIWYKAIDLQLQINSGLNNQVLVDLPDVTTLFKTDSVNCLISSYEVVYKDSSGNYVNSTSLGYIQTDNRLYVKTDKPTSPYVQNLYIKATTNSGRFDVIPFTVKICGAEVITDTHYPNVINQQVPFFQSLYGDTTSLTDYLVSQVDVQTLFTSENPECPITYSLEEMNSLGQYVPFSKVNEQSKPIYISDSTIYPQKILEYHTVTSLAPFDYQNLFVVAETQGGLKTRMKLRVKVCGNEQLLIPTGVQTLMKYVFPKQSRIESKDVTDFRVSTDLLCPIASFSLMTKDMLGNYVNYSNNCSVTCLQGSNLLTDQDQPQDLKLFLKVVTVTNFNISPYTRVVSDYQEIQIKVCGNEVLTLSIQQNLEFYFKSQTGIQTLENNLQTWFVSSDPDCSVVKYELLDNSYREYIGPVQIQSGTLKKLSTTTDKNYNKEFYVKATTLGQVTIINKVSLQICGQEELHVPIQKYDLLYQMNSGENGYQYLNNLYSVIQNNDEPNCPTMYYLEQNGQVYTKNLAVINLANQQIVIQTKNHANETVQLRAITKGGVTTKVDIMIEVCGSEEIQFTSNLHSVQLSLLQKSGPGFLQRVKPLIYSMVKSTNPRCDIDKTMTELLEQNDQPYENNRFRLQFDQPTTLMSIKTLELYSLNLKLKVQTTSGKPFFIPVYIEIMPMEKLKVIVNIPPIFQDPNTYYFNFTVSVNSDVDMFKFEMPVTEQFDEMNMLKWLNFSSPTFGNAQYMYEEASQVAGLYARTTEKIMFNHENNDTLVCTLKKSQLPKVQNAIYPIVILLSDAFGLTAKKIIMFNLTINDVNLDNLEAPVYEIYLNSLALITHISVFGEVDIVFNESEQWKPKLLPPQQLYHLEDNFKVWIEAAENWDKWLEDNPKLLNLDFEIREFSLKKMRLKLTFENPQSVSPLARYDKLKIEVPDLLSLFDFEDNGRQLLVVHYKLHLEKRIQKQMYDTNFTRRLVNFIYNLRTFIIGIFLCSVVLALNERAPFDRLLQLTLILQLIFNLPLLHVPLPASFLISAEIFKPWISFDLVKGVFIDRFQRSKETEIFLEDLGQRDTFRYSSLEAIKNLGTIGGLICLIVLKVFVVLLIKGFQACCSKEKSKRWEFIEKKKYKSLLGEVAQSEFLLFLTITFLELVSAGLLTITSPMYLINTTNLLFSILLVFGIFVILPLIYIQIFKEAQLTLYRNTNFSKKWGFFLLGVHIVTGYKDKMTRRKKFSYLACFFAARYIFVAIAFFLHNATLQIIILISVFLFQAANFCAVMPFCGKWNNRLGIFNQVSLVVVIIHLSAFTDNNDKELQYRAGFTLILSIILVIIVNIIFFALDIWYLIKNYVYWFGGRAWKFFCPKRKAHQVKQPKSVIQDVVVTEKEAQPIKIKFVQLNDLLPKRATIIGKQSRVQISMTKPRLIESLSVVEEHENEYRNTENTYHAQTSTHQLLDNNSFQAPENCESPCSKMSYGCAECGLPPICCDSVPEEDQYCHACKICQECSKTGMQVILNVIKNGGSSSMNSPKHSPFYKNNRNIFSPKSHKSSHCGMTPSVSMSHQSSHCGMTPTPLGRCKCPECQGQSLLPEIPKNSFRDFCFDLECNGQQAQDNHQNVNSECSEPECKERGVSEVAEGSKLFDPNCMETQIKPQRDECTDPECLGSPTAPNLPQNIQSEETSNNSLPAPTAVVKEEPTGMQMRSQKPAVNPPQQQGKQKLKKKQRKVTFNEKDEVILSPKKNKCVFDLNTEELNAIEPGDLEKYIDQNLFN